MTPFGGSSIPGVKAMSDIASRTIESSFIWPERTRLVDREARVAWGVAPGANQTAPIHDRMVRRDA